MSPFSQQISTVHADPASSSTTKQTNPTLSAYNAYRRTWFTIFLLEIQGVISDSKVIVGGFKSVSGMDSETEIVEFKQGNDMVVKKPAVPPTQTLS